MRFVCLSWITKAPGRAQVGFVPNKHNPSTELGLGACISSRITVVIHVRNDYQINDNCFNEPFAVSPCKSLYWDMHGLIFETSIWLLAGSTRLICWHRKLGNHGSPRLLSAGGSNTIELTKVRAFYCLKAAFPNENLQKTSHRHMHACRKKHRVTCATAKS